MMMQAQNRTEVKTMEVNLVVVKGDHKMKRMKVEVTAKAAEAIIMKEMKIATRVRKVKNTTSR